MTFTNTHQNRARYENRQMRHVGDRTTHQQRLANLGPDQSLPSVVSLLAAPAAQSASENRKTSNPAQIAGFLPS
jgi:hypothetical protein